MTDIRRFGANNRMSNAVSHGGVVYLSGQVAVEHAGGSVEEQTGEILQRIDDALAQAGSDKSRLLWSSLYLQDLRSLPAVNSIWCGWLAPGAPPTRTTIQVVLASPDYALEIAATAAV